MPDEQASLAAAIDAVDRANAADPNVVAVEGVTRPKELVHGESAHRWLLELHPAATAVQQVAARAHHLRRWVDPRADHPPGRAGYLRWRKAQQRRHARDVEVLLGDLGWTDAMVADVAALIRKDARGSTAAAQAHEDALCLTFLELQLDEMLERLGAEAVTEVLRKTMGKMSAAALERAGALPLSPAGAAALSAAAASR